VLSARTRTREQGTYLKEDFGDAHALSGHEEGAQIEERILDGHGGRLDRLPVPLQHLLDLLHLFVFLGLFLVFLVASLTSTTTQRNVGHTTHAHTQHYTRT
jgi:hypothetical protein